VVVPNPVEDGTDRMWCRLCTQKHEQPSPVALVELIVSKAQKLLFTNQLENLIVARRVRGSIGIPAPPRRLSIRSRASPLPWRDRCEGRVEDTPYLVHAAVGMDGVENASSCAPQVAARSERRSEVKFRQAAVQVAHTRPECPQQLQTVLLEVIQLVLRRLPLAIAQLLGSLDQLLEIVERRGHCLVH